MTSHKYAGICYLRRPNGSYRVVVTGDWRGTRLPDFPQRIRLVAETAHPFVATLDEARKLDAARQVSPEVLTTCATI